MNFRQMSIQSRLLTMAAVGMLFLVLVAGLAYVGLTQLQRAYDATGTSVVMTRNQMEADMMHDAIRGDVLQVYALLAGGEIKSEQMQASKAELAQHIQVLREHFKKNQNLAQGAELKAMLNRVEPMLNTYAQLAQSTQDKLLARETDAAEQQEKFKASFETLETEMAKISDAIERDAKNNEQAWQQTVRSVVWTMGGSLALALVVQWLLSMAIGRSLISPIRSLCTLMQGFSGDLTYRAKVDGRDEVAAMASAYNSLLDHLGRMIGLIRQTTGDMASMAERLRSESAVAANNTYVMADKVMALSAGTEQMSVAIQEVSGNIQQAAHSATETATMAVSSKDSMQLSISKTQQIMGSVKSSGAMIKDLSDTVLQIGNVAMVIKEIADQTNLLALNAAIEAARAGEQGRGFAVVADEVRKLAERTTASTGDITRKIEEIRHATSCAVDAMEQVEAGVNEGESLLNTAMQAQDQIVDATRGMQNIASHIADATRQQSTTVNETARGMSQISELSEQAAMQLQTIKQESDGLESWVTQLQQAVAKFRTE